MRLGFRHCDPRFGFLWLTAQQPAARWHAEGRGPANYFADTPSGAWAEFLRHEEITDAEDLAGVRRSLWAVELPQDGYAPVSLPNAIATGGVATWPSCQQVAERLRKEGHTRLEAPSAALLPDGASGWFAHPEGLDLALPPRDGRVWVIFGDTELRGWITVDAGAPPAALLPWVRPL